LKRMLINAIDPEESRIAVVEDGVLQELHVELANREAYLGNIYKGKVVNIEPSIGAAFVAFGGRVNGFLHVSDVLPAYGRPEFMLDDVIEGRARVDVDDGPEAMQQALSDDDDDDTPAAQADHAPVVAEPVVDESNVTLAHGEDEEHDPREPTDVHGGETAGAGGGESADHDSASGEDETHPREGDERAGGHEDGESDEVEAADGEDSEDEDSEHEDSGADDAEGADDDDPEGDFDIGFGHGVDDRPHRMAAEGGEGDDDDVPPVHAAPVTVPAAAGDSGADSAGDVVGHEGVGQPVAAEEPAGDSGEVAEAPAGQGEGQETADGASRRNRRNRRDRRDRDKRSGGSGGGGGGGGAGGGDRRPRGPRPTIDQLLRKGQEVVVQITKEGIGSKGPTLTTYVSLPGRCLVLMPSLPKCGVSRKIEDGRERKRLKRIVRELDETGSGGIGFIVRTAGINKSLQDLERDRDYLKKIWEMVAQRLKVTRAPALLYQESDLVLKAMRDQFTPDIADVVVDSEDVFLRIRDFADKLMPHMAERIKNHSMTTPLFHHFGIEKEVEALYQPKVDLPNGASIVIDQTEALVAIDVNSGKFKAAGDSDETAYRTNLDAIPEIVRHLRLRDLGGLIIIDFIDMSHEKHRRGVERRLIDALRGDRARIKVGRISPFGMLEITRQRVGPGLKRTVFMQCPHCKGAGWSRTVQSKALSVLRETRALLNLKGYSVLQVFAAPAVTDYLVNYKRRGILELEDAVGKTVLFRPEPSYPIDVVHYRFLTGDGQEARIAIPAGLGVKA
jgi:ribonuclease E